MKSVKEYGAVGNGIVDETAAFLKAFGSEEKYIYIPKGDYIVSDTLYITSDKTIIADSAAFIKCADGCFKKESSFLIRNEDVINGNKNITIIGGIWDGNNINNMCRTYKDGDQTGILFEFMNVENLKISDVVLQNSERFHLRINRVSHFEFTNIYFNDTNLRPCNDGINIGGFCEFGKIKGVGARKGATNDDLIAFNADDNESCMTRGKEWGFIRNIEVEDVYAEDVYTAVRIVSVESEVSNISIKNLHCGIREYGLNLDAGRYCMDPIFDDEKYPKGVGNLHNIHFENITLYKTIKSDRPICVFEQNARNFVFKKFRFIDNQFHELGKPAFVFNNMCETALEVDGEVHRISLRKPYELYGTDFESITINSYI